MHLFEVLHHHFKLKLTMQVGKPSNLDYTLAGNVNICWLAHALKHSFIYIGRYVVKLITFSSQNLYSTS